jgi:hypothetical protein
MAKLQFCSVAFEIRSALDERRTADAERIATKHLRAGYHSPEFLNIVAEMIEDKNVPREPGRPGKKCPQRWWEIGQAFEDLGGYNKPTQAIKELVRQKWGSRGTVRKAVDYFKEAKIAHDDATAEFVREKKHFK